MAEFTEKQVYEALGIEPEKPTEGGKEQAPADPAPKETPPTTEEGEKEQEPAAPATVEEGAPETTPKDGSPTEEPGEPSEGGEPGEMTEQQRREHAAARRRQEQQDAIDAAVEKAIQEERGRSKAEMDAFFRTAQLKNTITGEPITTMEEYQAWQKAYAAAQLQRDLKAGKLTPEALAQAIQDNPAMQKVQGLIEREEETRKQQGAQEAQVKINAELEEIKKLDPSIQSVTDLLKMPKAKEFYGYVTKNGLSFLEAFKLVNGAEIAAHAAEAAKIQAMSGARSKEHLTRTSSQGAGAVTVPKEEMALFRELLPEATDAEIQAYYNSHKN